MRDARPASARIARLPQRLALGAAMAICAAATLLALAELGVRAVYWYAFRSTEQAPLIYERVFWAVPPWVSRTSVLYDDPELGLWMKPGANRTYVNLYGPIGSLDDVGRLFDTLFPELPAWASQRPVWHLRTNAAGLRGDELPTQKPPGTFRIVVLGDSWTVGINVEQELAYPAVLRDLLAEGLADARVEVLNFGVIGAGAETGVRALPRVLALSPDLLIVAYAQNDEAETRDPRPRSARPIGQPSNAPERWSALPFDAELYRLYRWWRTPGDDRIAATLHRELTRTSLMPSNAPGRGCPNPDPAATRYSTALDRIVADATVAGVPVVLLYNNVPNFLSHCTLHAMRQIARSRSVPLVDSSTLLEDLEHEIQSARARRLALSPDGAPARSTHKGIDAVFRVDMTRVAPVGRPSVMGNAPQLGGFTPNQVALYDDATHGDQVAGDGVWSRAVRFDAPQLLTYAFTNGTTAGSWTGLENYRLRAYALRDTDRRRTVLLPIEEFGVHALRSDSSHPDAAGHRAIAEQLAQTVRTAPAFAAFARAHAMPTDAAAARGAAAADLATTVP